jgi:hypothetical protein
VAWWFFSFNIEWRRLIAASQFGLDCMPADLFFMVRAQAAKTKTPPPVTAAERS